MHPEIKYQQEAVLFGQYLLSYEPDEESLKRYVRASLLLNLELSKRDERILDFVRKHPSLIGLIDAGLALTEPNSAFRHKVLLMFAILEAQPHYFTLFFPEQISWFRLILIGCSSGLKALGGGILVKLI